MPILDLGGTREKGSWLFMAFIPTRICVQGRWRGSWLAGNTIKFLVQSDLCICTPSSVRVVRYNCYLVEHLSLLRALVEAGLFCYGWCCIYLNIFFAHPVNPFLFVVHTTNNNNNNNSKTNGTTWISHKCFIQSSLCIRLFFFTQKSFVVTFGLVFFIFFLFLLFCWYSSWYFHICIFYICRYV